jgi:lipopolysaccharide transport system ATP-binding protein
MKVIDVRGIGKQYRLGGQHAVYRTFREDLLGLIKRPFRRSATARAAEYIWVLKDINFTADEGDIIGLIGRNGAGKSTLLKILSRITAPTEGTAYLRGRLGSLLEVGTGFHPELTGYENIFLSGTILGMRRAEIKTKLDVLIAFSELERFIDTPVKHYSSGMLMRLAFSVAAHLEPEILLIDEVLAVGDAAFQKKCLGKMDDVSKGGRTVIFVSHNMAAIQRLCTWCILLDSGRMVASGPTSEITALYLDSAGSQHLTWERNQEHPGSDGFFSRVTLVDNEGKPLSSVTTSTQLVVEMEYTIVRTNQRLCLSVGLQDNQGDQIFGTEPMDVGVELPKEAGRYLARVVFPAELFLPKAYRIAAALWTPTDGTVDLIESLKFVAEESDSFVLRNPAGRPGHLAIRCDWEVLQRR